MMIEFHCPRLIPMRMLLIAVAAVLAPSAHAHGPTELGAPPTPPTPPRVIPKSAVAPRGPGLTVDILNRAAVVDFYNAHYVPDLAAAALIGWTGSIAGCVPGTTSAAHDAATLDMVNYHRAMALLPANLTFDPVKNAKCQQAALMMIAEGALSHTPPPEYACFMADGAEAAGKSNLTIGRFGPDGVAEGYMEDPGESNRPSGHRRSIFYPRLAIMGTGSTDGVNGFFTGSNALWVIAGFDERIERPTSPEFVAWPPPGFVPFQLFDSYEIPGFDFFEYDYPRWSLAPNVTGRIDTGNDVVDFSATTVEMTIPDAKGSIPLTIVSRDDFFGDDTLVWEPDIGLLGLGPGMKDLRVTVNVNNVMVEGNMRSYHYTVTLIDPAVAPPPNALRNWQIYD